MAKAPQLKAPKGLLCPNCGGTGRESEPDSRFWTCASCGQTFGDRNFYARGKEAMEPQVAIVNYYHKMTVLRAIAAYRCPLFSQL
jgi:transposase-like protein